MQQKIHNPRFLAQLSRHVLGRHSRFLHRCQIVVVDYHSDSAGLVIEIGSRTHKLFTIAWARDQAWWLPSSRLRRADVSTSEDALTHVVRRFLRTHGFIDAYGRSTRRHTA